MHSYGHNDFISSLIILRLIFKIKVNVLDTEQFLPKVIVDFNMASSGVSYEKRSYMSVEMTLFQKILRHLMTRMKRILMPLY